MPWFRLVRLGYRLFRMQPRELGTRVVHYPVIILLIGHNPAQMDQASGSRRCWPSPQPRIRQPGEI